MVAPAETSTTRRAARTAHRASGLGHWAIPTPGLPPTPCAGAKRNTRSSGAASAAASPTASAVNSAPSAVKLTYSAMQAACSPPADARAGEWTTKLENSTKTIITIIRPSTEAFDLIRSNPIKFIHFTVKAFYKSL